MVNPSRKPEVADLFRALLLAGAISTLAFAQDVPPPPVVPPPPPLVETGRQKAVRCVREIFLGGIFPAESREHAAARIRAWHLAHPNSVYQRTVEPPPFPRDPNVPRFSEINDRDPISERGVKAAKETVEVAKEIGWVFRETVASTGRRMARYFREVRDDRGLRLLLRDVPATEPRQALYGLFTEQQIPKGPPPPGVDLDAVPFFKPFSGARHPILWTFRELEALAAAGKEQYAANPDPRRWDWKKLQARTVELRAEQVWKFTPFSFVTNVPERAVAKISEIYAGRRPFTELTPEEVARLPRAGEKPQPVDPNNPVPKPVKMLTLPASLVAAVALYDVPVLGWPAKGYSWALMAGMKGATAALTPVFLSLAKSYRHITGNDLEDRLKEDKALQERLDDLIENDYRYSEIFEKLKSGGYEEKDQPLESEFFRARKDAAALDATYNGFYGAMANLGKDSNVDEVVRRWPNSYLYKDQRDWEKDGLSIDDAVTKSRGSKIPCGINPPELELAVPRERMLPVYAEESLLYLRMELVNDLVDGNPTPSAKLARWSDAREELKAMASDPFVRQLQAFYPAVVTKGQLRRLIQRDYWRRARLAEIESLGVRAMAVGSDGRCSVNRSTRLYDLRSDMVAKLLAEAQQIAAKQGVALTPEAQAWHDRLLAEMAKWPAIDRGEKPWVDRTLASQPAAAVTPKRSSSQPPAARSPSPRK